LIPRAHITAWRSHAPWPLDSQIEQDLILSRALVELYSEDSISGHLAFRGGTALHKLYLPRSQRYSEDIDLVQVDAGPIGSVMTAIHQRLDPWLGKPQWKQGAGRVTLYYRFRTEIEPEGWAPTADRFCEPTINENRFSRHVLLKVPCHRLGNLH
jgi:hypothetical protein